MPIITNKNLLVADGEHRLRAAEELGLKQVSAVRLPVSEVDRRLIRQVMNKLRGEHDLFLDAEEYYRIVCEDQRDLLKSLLNESDLRIDNLLTLREPASQSERDLIVLAENFGSKVETNLLDPSSEARALHSKPVLGFAEKLARVVLMNKFSRTSSNIFHTN